MNCVALAAGYATRLYPLTENFPKPLLPIAGKPILDRLFDDLDSCGRIERFVVVSNARYADVFRKWRDAKSAGENGATPLSAPIEILDDGSTTNETRIGAVKDALFALETLALSGETLVVAGDNVLDFSLTKFVEYFDKLGETEPTANACMRYFEPDASTLVKRGVLELGEGDRVLSMEEKPAEPKSQWCVPPFYCYRNLSSAKIRAALDDGCGFDAPGSLLSWLCRREPTFAFETPGRRYDVGDLASYTAINATYRGFAADAERP